MNLTINVVKSFTNFNMSQVFWRFLLSIGVCSISILSSHSAPTKITDKGAVTQKLRAVSAREQKELYRKYLKKTESNKRDRLLNVTEQPDVQIHLSEEQQANTAILFYDNMESGTNGWTTVVLDGVDDLWHQTTVDAGTPTHSWWLGIEETGTYETGRRIQTALVSPSVDLTSAAAPVSLLFAENYFTEWGWDFCMVDVTTDGGTSWIPLRGVYGVSTSGYSFGWKISTLDLSPYAGQVIRIRFHFDTGDTLYNDFTGWFIDDVVIFAQGGHVTGNVLLDVNNNGMNDDGGRGIKDFVITASGPMTLITTTRLRGSFELPLPLGTYTIAQTRPTGWSRTYPSSDSVSVTLATPDTVIDSVFFGNWHEVSVFTGTKYNDANRSGSKDIEETGIFDWSFMLLDSLYQIVDFDRTDSNGAFELYAFEPGVYTIDEVNRHGWVQTQPDTGYYSFDLPTVGLTYTDLYFGNYYSDSSATILGQKFNDLNRNGVKDDHEPGLSGWTIQLATPGGMKRNRVTDSLGYYSYLGLPEHLTYTIREIGKPGWCQSMPASTYTVTLNSGEVLDSLDFGNYEALASSISGVVYYDENGNAVRDSGEIGLSGFDVFLDGFSNGSVVTAVATSDDTGGYRFPGLWPGNYTVSEIFRQGYVQTYPQKFGSHSIALGCEEIYTLADFGNIDSVYLASFRTFSMRGLALAKDQKGRTRPVLVKPDKCEFCVTFQNSETDFAVKLTVKFSYAPIESTLTFSKHGTVTVSGKIVTVEFAPALQVGDSITICGFTSKRYLQKAKRWWAFANGSNSAKAVETNFSLNALRYPMPNALNVIEKVGAGLRIGLGGPNSIVHSTYKHVIKSLVESRERVHSGPPRCLDKTSNGSPIKKEKKYLKPGQGQNILFANAVAFKVNILASQLGVTPAGFGGLVFDDGTGLSNPLNNFSLYQLAAKLDSFMTQEVCNPIPAGATAELWNVVLDSINAAFEGPMDTISFVSELKLTAVRTLASVTILRYDTGGVQRQYSLLDMPLKEQPEVFALYQNYPNPFNPTTTIEFNLPTPSLVTIKVYNTLGQEVAALLDNEEMDEGPQDVQFSSSEFGLASGVYYYRIVAQTFDEEDQSFGEKYVGVRKMLLLK
jgi:hypothetical protein